MASRVYGAGHEFNLAEWENTCSIGWSRRANFFTKTVKIDFELTAPVYYVTSGINKEYYQRDL